MVSTGSARGGSTGPSVWRIGGKSAEKKKRRIISATAMQTVSSARTNQAALAAGLLPQLDHPTPVAGSASDN